MIAALTIRLFAIIVALPCLVFLWPISDRINDVGPRRSSCRLLFGMDLALSTWYDIRHHRLLDTWHRRFERLGSTFLSILPARTVVHTSDIKNARRVLGGSSTWILPSLRLRLIPYCGQGIFTATDFGHWRASRKRLHRFFTTQSTPCHLADPTGCLEAVARELDESDGCLDLRALFKVATRRHALWMLLGIPLNCSQLHGLSDALDTVNARMAEDLLLGWFTRVFDRCKTWFQPQSTQSTVSERSWTSGPVDWDLRSFIERVVEEKGPEPSGDDRSLAAFLSRERPQLRTKVIVDELLNVLLAAGETTESVLVALFWHLAHAPAVYQQLRDEALNPDPTKSRDGSVHPKASLLMRCIRESK